MQIYLNWRKDLLKNISSTGQRYAIMLAPIFDSYEATILTTAYGINLTCEEIIDFRERLTQIIMFGKVIMSHGELKDTEISIKHARSL